MRAFELHRRAAAYLLLLAVVASAPMVAQTKTFSDPAIPVGIVSEPFYSIVDVLNKDRTITQYATQSISNSGYSCTAAPGLAAQGITPHVFAYDTNLFEIGPAATGSALAIAPITSPYYNGCAYGPLTTLPSTATSILATSTDYLRQRLFVLTSAGGTSPDTVIGYDASTFYLNNTGTLAPYGTANLDSGATYTAMVTDMDGAYGDTAISELRTATTAGDLWIYTTAGRAVKILAPDGSSLPAVNAFIIHNPNDLGGEFLVLVNQDGLTAANATNPPLDTNPFTLIDLGQLHQLIAASPGVTTITLPAITKISATTPYYAMLGAAWNPVKKLLYAVVGGGDASGNVFRHVLTYDPYNPSTPAETQVADVTAVPIAPPYYPQIALNAAAGTMQFLTQNPTAAYTVSLTAGATTTATQLGATTFASDPTFAPTAMTVNPLSGNTWFASSSGKVDTLTLPATSLVQAYLDLTAPEVVANTGSNSVHVIGYFPYNSDTSLYNTNVTVTATRQGGTPFTFGSASSTSVRVNGADISGTFPSAGIYTLTANFPGDSVQAAFTSSPVTVYVATPPFTPAVAVTAKATTSTTGTASVTLTGSSWVPTGTIKILDATSSAVLGAYTLSGPLSNPISIPITFPATTSRVTASYLGDPQNAPSSSIAATIAQPSVTPTLTLTGAGPTAFTSSTVNGNITFGSITTTVPTGNITIYTVPFYGTAQTTVATVAAATAFSAAGAGFTFTAPATSGNYTVYATYPGDSNYSAVTTPGSSLAVNAQVALATTLTVTAPATAPVNGLFSVNIKLSSSTSTQTPSGTINVTAKLAGSTTSNNIGIVNASQAYSTVGNSFNVTLPTVGVWTITANFYGDQNFSPSAGTATVTVNPATAVATTLKITAPANVAINTPYTAVVALTAASTLTSGPSGLVTIVVTSSTGAVISTINTTAASAFLGSGYSASIPAATAPGTYTLTASYAGDSNYSASSVTSLVTVGSTLSTTTMGISGPTNVTLNVPSPLTIRLIPQTGVTAIPTGNVVITSVNPSGVTATLGTITAAQALASGGDVATINYSILGNFTVTATYSGDANFSGSTASITVTVGPAAVIATSLTLKTPPTATVGTPYTATVILTPASVSTPSPTGSVTLTSTSNGASTPVATFTAAQALSGVSYMVPANASGTVVLTAAYAGDTNYSAALPVSNTVVVGTATGLTSNISVSSLSQTGPNIPTVVSVVLLGAGSAHPNPTGKITISITPSGGTPTVVGTLDAAVVTASASSSGSVTALFPAAGSYTVIATYSGDSIFSSSASSSPVYVLVYPDTLAITGPATGPAPTSSITFNLLQTGTAPAISGTVTISSTCNGSAGPSTTIPAILGTAGPANFSLAFSTAGTCTLVASYSGDAANLPATSPGFTITLTSSGTPGFTSFVTGASELTLIEPTVTSTTLNLTALNGFTTPIAFTYIDAATNAAPENLTFTITDPTSGKPLTTVVPTSAGTKVVLTVAYTTSGQLAVPFSLRDTGVLACAILCAGCFSVRRRYPLKRMRLLTVALFLLSTLTLAGCDGPLGCGSLAPNSRTIHVIATPINGSQNATPQTVDIVVLN